MKKELIGLSFGVGAMILAAQEAFAQNSRHCGERAQVVNRLAEGYGESRRSMGLGSNNSVIEIFASEETGTWTITVTLPNGQTCLVASGMAYEEIEEELQPTGHSL